MRPLTNQRLRGVKPGGRPPCYFWFFTLGAWLEYLRLFAFSVSGPAFCRLLPCNEMKGAESDIPPCNQLVKPITQGTGFHKSPETASGANSAAVLVPDTAGALQQR